MTRRPKARRLEEGASELRVKLYELEGKARLLRERMRVDADALDGLMPQVMAARDAYRLAERALAIAREPRR